MLWAAAPAQPPRAPATTRSLAFSEAGRRAALGLRGTEQLASDTVSQIDLLGRERAALEAALRQEAARLGPLLPLIERLSLYPAQTLLASNAAPRDALTALMVLRGLGTELEARAARLRAREQALALIERRLRSQRLALLALRRQQIDGLQRATEQADAAAALQLDAHDPASERSRRAAGRAAAAGTLREALGRLEPAALGRAEPPAAPALATAASRTGLAAGALVPVAGRLVQGWGSATDVGPASGLTYAPPALALVASPCNARVDFAAPFRSYGRMLILDCGSGWRFVLAGLDRLDVAVGQPVPRGAPLGRMPDWSPSQPGGRPTLYVQLRRGAEPVDPLPYLRRPA